MLTVTGSDPRRGSAWPELFFGDIVVSTLDAYTVAELLQEIGNRLELTGESSFKIRAYRNASETLRKLKTPLSTLIEERRLMKLPGVGEAIAEKIIALHKRGTHRTLERLREEVPSGLLDLVELPGLGPKKVLLLRKQLGIEDLTGLAAAIREEKLTELKGFGPKLQSKLKEALGFVRASAGRVRLPHADAAIAGALESLENNDTVVKVEVAGEARRRCETITRLRVVAATKDSVSLPTEVGEVQVLDAAPEHFGARLVCATGSAAHVAELEDRAEEKGMSLSSEGLYRGQKALPTPDEKSVYEALDLPFIEPEMREGRGEVEAAAKGRVPSLVTWEDIRGILHCHTIYSDGIHSLEETAEAVREMGMDYFGVAEHSQSAGYAGGLKEDRVRRQHEEVDTLNELYVEKHKNGDIPRPFKIFKGIESDILGDGSLDYPDEVLRSFDFIVASVHLGFEYSTAKQTERVIRAISHPATTMLGHPTGRLLLRRKGFTIDIEKVIEACAKHGVAIEINAHPMRLDLDWRWHAKAVEAGVLLSINPDAHNIEELMCTQYGIDVARKGGLEPENVLNTKDLKAIERFFEKRKKKWK